MKPTPDILPWTTLDNLGTSISRALEVMAPHRQPTPTGISRATQALNRAARILEGHHPTETDHGLQLAALIRGVNRLDTLLQIHREGPCCITEMYPDGPNYYPAQQ